MLAVMEITPWHWVAFVTTVLVLLALDLGVFHRQARVVKLPEALFWTGIWMLLALAFAFCFVDPVLGGRKTILFLTGYITELSLSMDNVFVIVLIFAYFRIPMEQQHRVLFWGILGALIMRGLMIWAGVKLIEHFTWLLYVCGAFLVFSGWKMLVADEEGVHPDKNPVIRVARHFYPVCAECDGQKLITVRDGLRMLTPLAIVLLMVETTDLIFAVDSIPAIFGFTTDPFIVFTSNVFAILGLRSLYFVLAGAIGYFRYLKVGLSVVLVFIGVKMLLDPHLEENDPIAAKTFWFQVDIEPAISLAVVASIIFISIVISVFAARYEARAKGRRAGDDAQLP